VSIRVVLIAALAAASLADEAVAGCDKIFYFNDGALCTANHDAILDIIPTAVIGPCSRGKRCLISPCSISVSIPDGAEATCNQLETALSDRKVLTERYVGLCQLSVAGKPFGKLYEPLDRSRHFNFNAIVSATGKPDETRWVDLALTGKNAVQRVALPPGAKRCVPRTTTWDCSGLGDDLFCYQPGMKFNNGPSTIKFAKIGDFGACADFAKTLQQMPSLLSVAACLVPPLKPIPPSVADGVKQAQEKGSCPGTWNVPFVEAYQQCIVNFEGPGDAWADCCDIIRKRAQEKNGKGITIGGHEFFKGNGGGNGNGAPNDTNKPD
jgi:hypothetical protein